jgi:hypothetical protein
MCEKYGLTLREEHKLRVFEIRVLKIIRTEEGRSGGRVKETAYCVLSAMYN